MDLKLEVEALWDAGTGMKDCCSVLEDVYNDVTSINIDYWQGSARTTFDEILKGLKDKTSSCVARLGDSGAVIVKALEKYREIEIANIQMSENLPSDDIF